MAADLSAGHLQAAGELEIEMMQDLYKRMTTACHQKCVKPKYKDSELTKGESICIDRCVAKYMEVQISRFDIFDILKYSFRFMIELVNK